MAESNAELLLTVREFRELLRTASSSMSFTHFCELLELEDDAYARDKYLEWGQLGAALSRFSPTSLERLLIDERTRS